MTRPTTRRATEFGDRGRRDQMGILVRSAGVRNVAADKLREAHAADAKDGAILAGAAAADAAAIESATRSTSINYQVLALIVVFIMFVIGAGIVTESQKLPEWGALLKNAFNVLWPLLLGYFGGEFVAEKTK
jgi:hypothetical protein